MHATLPTRAAAALAATALTAGGIMAAATMASAAPQPKLDATKLSISNKVVAHAKHHADTITGVLTSDHKGVANETVALEARMGVAPRWKVVGTGTTGTGGTVTFTLVTPKVKTQFKLVFAGDITYRGSQSNVITVLPVK